MPFACFSVQLTRRALQLLHGLLVAYNDTCDVLSFLTKPLYRMYIIMFYEMYFLRDYYEDLQDLRGTHVSMEHVLSLHILVKSIDSLLLRL
jgi:hypothetical protein